MKILSSALTTAVLIKICNSLITLNNVKTVPYNNSIIASLVSDSILEEKHSVTVLFSKRTERIDECLRYVYENTVFGIQLIGRRFDGGKHYETLLHAGSSQWFLVIGDEQEDDEDEDDEWWKQALAEIYTHGPYRPTVVIWFNEPLTMASKYHILQVTWYDYWFHKALIAYPYQCNRNGLRNCVVLTGAKDAEQIDSQISMISLLVDENNLKTAIDAMKTAQLEFETDFKGRKFKTAVSVKTNYVETVQLPGNQTQLVGIDIEALSLICAQLNLTPVFEIIGHGSGYVDNLNATIQSLDNRKESFFLNRYFNSPSIKEYILPVNMDSFYFTVKNRQSKYHLWKIFSGFKPTVWTMVGVTFVLVAVIWKCILTGSVLSLVQAALSTSHIILRRTRHRLVWISWLLFVLLIVNSLNGTIVTQLTKPVHSRDINTLKDLLESDMRLYTEVRGFTSTRQDPVVTALTAKLVDVNVQRPSIDEVNQAAFLMSRNTRSILTRLNKSGDHDFYVIPEVVGLLNTGYLMSPRNPAFDTFKRTIKRLLETGYYEKWTRDYVNNVTQNRDRYYFDKLYNSTGGRDRTSAMSFVELALAFRLYLSGILIAFLAFFGEIFIYKFRKRNQPKRPKQKIKFIP